MLGRIAYSKYFRSFIMIVEYKSDTDWYFVLCDSLGRPMSPKEKARSSITKYNWRQTDKYI